MDAIAAVEVVVLGGLWALQWSASLPREEEAVDVDVLVLVKVHLVVGCWTG